MDCSIITKRIGNMPWQQQGVGERVQGGWGEFLVAKCVNWAAKIPFWETACGAIGTNRATHAVHKWTQPQEILFTLSSFPPLIRLPQRRRRFVASSASVVSRASSLCSKRPVSSQLQPPLPTVRRRRAPCSLLVRPPALDLCMFESP